MTIYYYLRLNAKRLESLSLPQKVVDPRRSRLGRLKQIMDEDPITDQTSTACNCKP
jgi:hypothetical protein